MDDRAPATPDTTALRLTADGALGRIVLNRPEKLNALNRACLEDLAVAARWFDAQPAITVVVLSGAGRAFSAGFDLADPSWRALGPPEASAAVGRAMADAIGAMQAITVAAIHGYCIGGGVVLAAACDLRVSAAGTVFRIPEVDLGIPLHWTGVPRLARELGPALTKELVLTGRPFDAREAHAVRFVNRVVPNERLTEETDALAVELASKPALVLRITKQQVEQAVPAVPASDAGVDADVASLAEAFADPGCRTVAARYEFIGDRSEG
jgi:enoyl-CoA hydratase/3-hydroxypropionyl-coenzyme A dehydratase